MHQEPLSEVHLNPSVQSVAAVVEPKKKKTRGPYKKTLMKANKVDPFAIPVSDIQQQQQQQMQYTTHPHLKPEPVRLLPHPPSTIPHGVNAPQHATGTAAQSSKKRKTSIAHPPPPRDPRIDPLQKGFACKLCGTTCKTMKTFKKHPCTYPLDSSNYSLSLEAVHGLLNLDSTSRQAPSITKANTVDEAENEAVRILLAFSNEAKKKTDDDDQQICGGSTLEAEMDLEMRMRDVWYASGLDSDSLSESESEEEGAEEGDEEGEKGEEKIHRFLKVVSTEIRREGIVDLVEEDEGLAPLSPPRRPPRPPPQVPPQQPAKKKQRRNSTAGKTKSKLSTPVSSPSNLPMIVDESISISKRERVCGEVPISPRSIMTACINNQAASKAAAAAAVWRAAHRRLLLSHTHATSLLNSPPPPPTTMTTATRRSISSSSSSSASNAASSSRPLHSSPSSSAFASTHQTALRISIPPPPPPLPKKPDTSDHLDPASRILSQASFSETDDDDHHHHVITSVLNQDPKHSLYQNSHRHKQHHHHHHHHHRTPSTPAFAQLNITSPLPTPTSQKSKPSFSIILESSSKHHPTFYQNANVEKYASKSIRKISLRQLTVFGRHLTEEKLIQGAEFLREELAVRLAVRIRAFETFRTLSPITTLEQNRQFCEKVQALLNAHLITLPLLQKGISETKSLWKGSQKFFTDNLKSRISRRVLAEQHIHLSASFDGHIPTEQGWIGIVNTRTHPAETVRKCANLAAENLKSTLPSGHQPPKVQLDGLLNGGWFTSIPDHVEYILTEILSSSMRATHHSHSSASSEDEVPPIRVTIASTPQTLTLRISDQGGSGPSRTLEEEKVGVMDMCKVYASYLGGGIEVEELAGLGRDIYVKIDVKGDIAECL
ncbi:hypothetical protein HDV05_005451 [Chytridiales sp. JEL 0842]|nr:hypothetical protein HDV05_005451 [Chytridiales sp. JEL 0842]